jgi:hypothetical protein
VGRSSMTVTWAASHSAISASMSQIWPRIMRQQQHRRLVQFCSQVIQIDHLNLRSHHKDRRGPDSNGTGNGREGECWSTPCRRAQRHKPATRWSSHTRQRPQQGNISPPVNSSSSNGLGDFIRCVVAVTPVVQAPPGRRRCPPVGSVPWVKLPRKTSVKFSWSVLWRRCRPVTGDYAVPSGDPRLRANS